MARYRRPRLADLPENEGIELAHAFIADLLRQHATPDYDLTVAVQPAHAQEDFKITFGEVRVVGQEGNDLSERLAYAAARLVARHQKGILLTPDLPYVDQRTVVAAFERLSHADLVVGPTHAGRFYLIGFKRALPLFSGVTAHRPCDQILRNAAALGLVTESLPVLGDLDSVDDLAARLDELLADHLPATQACVKKLMTKYPARFAGGGR